MNRRLRLALLLAALAAAGPAAASPQTVDATRPVVSVAWFRVTPAQRAPLEMEQAGLKTRPYVAIADARAFTGGRDQLLPDTLRVHSLFQRPPPLHS